MSRVDNIIIRVRDSLSDTDGDRWSTARLIRLLDEAQKDIVLRSKALRGTYLTLVTSKTPLIQLPEEVLMPTRVLRDGKKIDFFAHKKMDLRQAKQQQSDRSGNVNNIGHTSHLSRAWEMDTGPQILAIVYDKLERRELKAYPIIKDADDITYTITPADGIITDIPGTTGSTGFGILTNFSDDEENLIKVDTNGITTNITESVNIIKVYFVRKPATVTIATEDIEVDELFDTAIINYMIGTALEDDQDAQNRDLGAVKLKKYDKDAKVLEEHVTDNFTDNQEYYTEYDSFGFDDKRF